jgi:ATP-binding cassette subfamily F protein uup
VKSGAPKVSEWRTTNSDPETPLRRALAPDGDTIIFQDRTTHVAGWAARFLFRQDQLDLPIGRLSGGERARVHIARLMLQPADILLLDEPTHDLDIPTLEVLEANLADFPGCIVLVTHDRYLLDRLSSILLAMNAEAKVEFFAELSQWEQASQTKKTAAKPVARKDTAPAAPVKKKLSWKEAREYEQMEELVTRAEETLDQKRTQLERPEVTSDPALLTTTVQELDAAQDAVDVLYARWAELEAKQS